MDLITIVVVLVVACLIIHFVLKSAALHGAVVEGLTNAGTGEAGSAQSYAAAVKARAVQLQDELLISKYRKEYENVILSLDDLISLSMLKLCLNLDMTDAKPDQLVRIGELAASRAALNDVIKFVDGQ